MILLWMLSLQASPYEIIHYPVMSYSRLFPFRIEAVFSDEPSLVESGRVLGRPAGQSMYREYPMTFDGFSWSCEVPESDLSENGFEYLIIFQMLNEGIVSFPQNDPFLHPVSSVYKGERESIEEESVSSEVPQGGSIESGILILSPEPGSRVSAQDLVITLSLFNTPDADLKTVKILLNRKNITAKALISPEIITVSPNTAGLKTGTQTVEVFLSNNFGAAFKPLSWSFDLAAQNERTEKIFAVNGRVSMEYRNEQLENTTNNLTRARLDLTGTASKVSYGINVNWVDNESPLFQPRSTYGVFINSDYLDLELGDTYPLFSRNALWGTRVRGAHANIKFRLFNLQFVNGQTVRKVLGSYSFVDSSQVWRVSDYSFTRNVIAIKPSIGNVDKFNFYLSFVRTRDDTASIYPPDFLPGWDPLNHTYQLDGVTPRDNLVIGLGHSLYLDSRKFSWFTDLAFSLSNSDISGGAMDMIAFGDTTIAFTEVMELLGLPFTTDGLSAVFIINENTGIPVPMALSDDLQVQVFPTQFSQYPTMAFSSILSLDYYSHYINLLYKRIAPEYTALAHNGIMSDNKSLEVSDRIRLLSNRLFLTLKYSRSNDNLIEGIKQYTSDSRSTSVGFNLMPGPNLPTASINLKVHTRSNNATEVDTLITQGDINDPLSTVYIYNDPRVSNQNISQTINISQPAHFLGLKHSINLSYISTARRDLILLRPPGFNDISMDMKSYTVTGITHYSGRFIQTLSYSSSANSSAGVSQYNYDIAGARFESKFLDNRLSQSLSFKYTHAYGLINFRQYTLNSGLKINFHQNDLQFSLLFNKIRQITKEVNTLKIFVKYSYSF